MGGGGKERKRKEDRRKDERGVKGLSVVMGIGWDRMGVRENWGGGRVVTGQAKY